jgi:hypothetical protein
MLNFNFILYYNNFIEQKKWYAWKISNYKLNILHFKIAFHISTQQNYLQNKKNLGKVYSINELTRVILTIKF